MKNYIEKEWFVETPDGTRLVGSECPDCRNVFFPKKRICPECFGENITDYIVSRKGTLHAYTQSFMGPPSLDKPYVQAFVDMPEGFKLFTLLTNWEPIETTLKIGMDVEMIIDKIDVDKTGNDIIGYKFRPISTEEQS